MRPGDTNPRDGDVRLESGALFDLHNQTHFAGVVGVSNPVRRDLNQITLSKLSHPDTRKCPAGLTRG